MADPFQDTQDTPMLAGTRAVAVSPHDTNPLSDIPKALYVGGAGNITMRGVRDGTDVLWSNIPAGFVIPFRAAFIRATGTTATNIIAIY